MADDSQEVFDIIDDLGTPSPIEVYEATRDYDTRYIASAVGSAAQAGGGGGSQPAIRVTLAFDTPNFPVVGVPIYTPAVGDTISALGGQGYYSVPIAFNGTTPRVVLFFEGDDYTTTSIGDDPVGVSGANIPLGTHGETIGDTAASLLVRCLDTTRIMAVLHDGAGGDPESTTGEVEIVVAVLPAA